MAKLSSVQQLGENFLAVIENWKKEKRDKEMFEKEMQFKHRQMNLLNTYREGIIENQRVQQERLQNQFEADLSNQYLPSDKGTRGIDLNKRFGVDVFNPKGIYSNIQPTTPDPVKGANIEFKPGIGHLEVKTVDGKPVDYNLLKGISTGGSGSGSGTTTTKDPKLSQSASDGLAFLKDPVYNVVGSDKSLTADEVAFKFSKSINALKKDLLGSRTTVWFDTIVKKFGRIPTSDELDKEIVKHAEGKEFTATLTDTEVGELRRLSGYLENAETGIKRTQNKIKEMRTPQEEGKFLGIF